MHPAWALIGSFAAAELYKRFASPEQKARWEGFVKMHHGEAGVIMTALGALIRSPNLAMAGIGLMLHDREDKNKWFTGDKLRNFTESL